MEYEGLTQPQVAAALGISPTTVKRALAKAVRAVDPEALTVEGVAAGRRFTARRRVARGGEPWRFALEGGPPFRAEDAGDGRWPRAGRAVPEERIGAARTPTSESVALLKAAEEQIAWLRAELERREAALEREQLANADLRRLLLAAAPADAAEDDRRSQSTDVEPAWLRDLAAAIERAAKQVGIGKKHRRTLLARLAPLLTETGAGG